MAYQHDPDGPVVDRGAFRAFLIEKGGFILLGAVVIFIIIKIFNSGSNLYDEAIDLIKLDLRKSRYNYTLDDSEKVITICLWETGITSMAKKAHDGDTAALKDWEDAKGTVCKIIQNIYEDLNSKKITDVTLIVKLVNENNKDRALLVYKDNVLAYDITSEKEGG